MDITEKDKIKRKIEKKLKSFRNKMGSNIVWFDSLSKNRQYDLLFEWEAEKFKKRDIKSVKRFTYKKTDVIIYPASLKHFIRSIRETKRYTPSIVNIRESVIDILLKNQ